MDRVARVSELCTPYRHHVAIFNQLCNAITPELLGLTDGIQSAVDFASSRRTRPVIKFGLDESLDASKSKLVLIILTSFKMIFYFIQRNCIEKI